jgi:LPXTG-motif cell wall-anchored protein
MTEIEKEKAEGTFYSRPEVQEILKENKQKFDKWEKELGSGNSKPNFGKSPQGIILIAGILGILGFLLGYYFTRRRKQRSKN